MGDRLILFLALILLWGVVAFAEEESLTITTYYPSPYGSYNELQTNKLAVGYMSHAEQPKTTGDIRLKPWTSVPSTEAGVAGEVAVGSDNLLYVHDGTNWKKQGGDLIWFGNIGVHIKEGATVITNSACDYPWYLRYYSTGSGESKIEGGKIYTKAKGKIRIDGAGGKGTVSSLDASCDSDWVLGQTATCTTGEVVHNYPNYGIFKHSTTVTATASAASLQIVNNARIKTDSSDQIKCSASNFVNW